MDKAKLRDFVRRVRESRGAMDRKKKKKKVPLASVVQEGARGWLLPQGPGLGLCLCTMPLV